MTESTAYWLWWQLKLMTGLQRIWSWKKWISNTIICRHLVIVGPQARTSAGIFYLIWWVHRESITWALKTLVSSYWKANIYTYNIYNHIYIYISWDCLILPKNWKWPWVCGSKIISSWPYWGKPPIFFLQQFFGYDLLVEFRVWKLSSHKTNKIPYWFPAGYLPWAKWAENWAFAIRGILHCWRLHVSSVYS